MESINETVRETRLKAGMVAAHAKYLSYMKQFEEGEDLAELLENLREDVPFVLMKQKQLEEAARRMTLAEEKETVPEEELAKAKAQLTETVGILQEALADVEDGLSKLEAKIVR